MSSRRVELALARERLRVRSSVLRGEVVQQSRALTPLLSAADKGRDAVYWARTHPEWVAAAVVVLVVLRPRFVWRWGMRSWSLWQITRRWRVLLAGILPV